MLHINNTTPKTESEEQIELEQVRGSVNTLQNELIALGESKKGLTNLIEHLKNELDLLNVSVNEHKTKEELDRKRSIEANIDLLEERSKLIQDKKNVEVEIDNLKAILAKNQERQVNGEALLNTLTEKYTRLQESSFELSKVISLQKTESASIAKSMNNSKQEKEELDMKVAHATELLAKKEEEVAWASAKIVQFEAVMASNKAKISQMEEFIIKAKGELAGAEKELSSAKMKVEEELTKAESTREKVASSAHILNITEKRIEEKTIILKKMIEKAQSDKLIGNFII